jgi:hypothetical protein
VNNLAQDLIVLALIVAVCAMVAVVGCLVEQVVTFWGDKRKPLPPPAKQCRRDWDHEANIARYRGK